MCAHASGSGGLSDRFRFLYINRFLGSQFFKPASSNHSSHSPSPLVPCPLVSWSLSLLQRLPKVRCWGHHSHSHSQRVHHAMCFGDLARDRAHKTRGLPVVCCLCAVFDGGAGFTLTAILNHRSAGSGLLLLLLRIVVGRGQWQPEAPSCLLAPASGAAWEGRDCGGRVRAACEVYRRARGCTAHVRTWRLSGPFRSASASALALAALVLRLGSLLSALWCRPLARTCAH